MGDMELQIFSDRLKTLRLSLNITQKDFAEKIGVTASALSSYENNLKNPSISVAKRIAEAFDVSIDWLCGLSERKNYNDRIETYSDVIDLLNKLEQTDLQMEVFSVSIDKSDPRVHAITFNNLQMYNFLEEFRQILELKHNSTIEEHLYNLWVQDALEKYNEKIELEKYVRY